MAFLRLSLIAIFAPQALCSPHHGAVLRGTSAKVAFMQHGKKDPSLADQELERIQVQESLGHSTEDESEEGSGIDEERLGFDDSDENIEAMREEEEYGGSLAQMGKRSKRAKKDPSLADQELERIQVEESLGHASETDGNGVDEERLDFDDDSDMEDMRSEEEYGGSLAQTAIKKSAMLLAQVAQMTKKDPSLADQELKRIQVQENLGHSADDDGEVEGADEERLSRDDGDDDIQAMREEEEYSGSLAQTATRARQRKQDPAYDEDADDEEGTEPPWREDAEETDGADEPVDADAEVEKLQLDEEFGESPEA